jgi:SAM-dependent methyltransferase
MNHHYDTFWEVNGYKIIECLDCGFKHIQPLPGADNLTDFYQHIYHKQVKSFPYEAITAEDVMKRLTQLERNRRFSDVFDKVTELSGKNGVGRMLDIGCGNSLLGKYFQNRGWNVAGIEPGKEAAAYLRRFGLEITEVFVEDIDNDKLGLNDFSFINMQFVLEHIYNPLDVLGKLSKLLKPGGLIRVCVPNDFSEGQLAYAESTKAEMKWVCLPDHINYFSFDSLSGLLTRSGFREVYRTTNFPLEFLLLGGIDYYRDAAEQLKVKPFVNQFENAWIKTGRKKVLDSFYENLAKQGLGRSIFMYAVKQ